MASQNDHVEKETDAAPSYEVEVELIKTFRMKVQVPKHGKIYPRQLFGDATKTVCVRDKFEGTIILPDDEGGVAVTRGGVVQLIEKEPLQFQGVPMPAVPVIVPTQNGDGGAAPVADAAASSDKKKRKRKEKGSTADALNKKQTRKEASGSGSD